MSAHSSFTRRNSPRSGTRRSRHRRPRGLCQQPDRGRPRRQQAQPRAAHLLEPLRRRRRRRMQTWRPATASRRRAGLAPGDRLRLGQPVLLEGDARDGRQPAARRRRRAPHPREAALRAATSSSPITEADLASVGLSADSTSTRSRGRPRRPTARTSRSRSTPTRSSCSSTPTSARRPGLLDSDGKLKSTSTASTNFEKPPSPRSEGHRRHRDRLRQRQRDRDPVARLPDALLARSRAHPVPLRQRLEAHGQRRRLHEGLARASQSWVKKGWLNKGLDYAGASRRCSPGRPASSSQGEWEITPAQAVKGLKFGMVPVPTLFDKPAAQADSHTFVLPRRTARPEQRKQAMGFIKSMLDQSYDLGRGRPRARLPADARQREVQGPRAAGRLREVGRRTPSTTTPPGTAARARPSRTRSARSSASSSSWPITPQGALSAIKDQLKVYLNTPSPL